MTLDFIFLVLLSDGPPRLVSLLGFLLFTPTDGNCFPLDVVVCPGLGASASVGLVVCFLTLGNCFPLGVAVVRAGLVAVDSVGLVSYCLNIGNCFPLDRAVV